MDLRDLTSGTAAIDAGQQPRAAKNEANESKTPRRNGSIEHVSTLRRNIR